MNGTAVRFVRFGAGLLRLVTLGWILTGEAEPGGQEMPYQEGIPTNWSPRTTLPLPERIVAALFQRSETAARVVVGIDGLRQASQFQKRVTLALPCHS